MKGRRIHVPEKPVWAVPGRVMNTPSRMRSNDSRQNTSSSFEVGGRGPGQDMRCEAHAEVGIFLLLCVQ